MENASSIHLTSSEIGNLWLSSINDTMLVCVHDYFLAKVEDEEIRLAIELAARLTKTRLAREKELFTQEKMPIPQGFTAEDVNVTAPRLYSDTFFLHYVNAFASMGIGVFGRSLAMATRADVREFYTECVTSLMEQFNKTVDVLLSKGLYVRPPYISVPKKVDFVKKQNYLAGLFAEPRALNAIEISNLWTNIMANTLGKALVMGFAQVAKSETCRKFFVRGKEISKKHMTLFSTTLLQEDIPSPITWDSDVKNSTVAPFSDKLMMHHTVSLIAAGLGNYGVAISSSQRNDLSVTYARLMAEVAQYADDGAKIMIDNGWLEEAPQAEDRKKLSHR